jgi:hypothetical protein
MIIYIYIYRLLNIYYCISFFLVAVPRDPDLLEFAAVLNHFGEQLWVDVGQRCLLLSLERTLLVLQLLLRGAVGYEDLGSDTLRWQSQELFIFQVGCTVEGLSLATESRLDGDVIQEDGARRLSGTCEY